MFKLTKYQLVYSDNGYAYSFWFINEEDGISVRKNRLFNEELTLEELKAYQDKLLSAVNSGQADSDDMVFVRDVKMKLIEHGYDEAAALVDSLERPQLDHTRISIIK